MAKTVIMEDLTVEGDISADGGEVSIKGKVSGDITARSVEVLAGCEVTGAIKADIVEIEGRVTGSVACKDLSLKSTSDVKADVTAATMVSEKGGKLTGKVQITGGAGAA